MADAPASLPRYDEPRGPYRFLALARAFGPSRAFQVAVKMGLFEAIRVHREAHGAGMTAAQVARDLGLVADPGFRGVTDLLDLLVAEDCLTRQGAGAGALYDNTPEGEVYLCPGSRHYVGGLVVVNAERTYPQFLFLEHSLRTGRQPPEARALVRPILGTFEGAEDPDATARFALGMTGANLAAFETLASKFDFGRYSTLRDIGGSAAALSCALAAAHPHLRCASADLPALLPAARARIASEGLEGRVDAEAIDFFDESPFPPSDVITMSMILHDWGLEKKLLLMRKAFAALPPGGALIALDCIIDDARRANRFGLYMSLSMLTEFEEGRAFDYTFDEFDRWSKEVGFERAEYIHLGGPNGAAVAHKAGPPPRGAGGGSGTSGGGGGGGSGKLSR
ncbi:methyltransferase [Raphidocelis subcapitata]|uniref:Methyltransferase n=1 Tax=Raphidocelis subcapitata TaxID=307507 RepID=A0A2V0PCM9_9CHLO|nr:methyltransferase [Raphidocelis subcapitata]|eukprot:GBF95640.1 methyltransferase [Raphidocelis subcapitata]